MNNPKCPECGRLLAKAGYSWSGFGKGLKSKQLYRCGNRACQEFNRRITKISPTTRE